MTYDIFAASWPTRTNNEFGVADRLNSAPKYVVSSTLENPDWNNTTLIKENLPEEIARLKQQYRGNIAVLGSAALVQSLMGRELIDEYRLMVHPIVLGSGNRLFPLDFDNVDTPVHIKISVSGGDMKKYEAVNPESAEKLQSSISGLGFFLVKRSGQQLPGSTESSYRMVEVLTYRK